MDKVGDVGGDIHATSSELRLNSGGSFSVDISNLPTPRTLLLLDLPSPCLVYAATSHTRGLVVIRAPPKLLLIPSFTAL